MPASDTLTRPRPRPTVDLGADIDHVVHCHDENTALCGTDVTDQPWVIVAASASPCVVCADLETYACGCACGCCPTGDQP